MEVLSPGDNDGGVAESAKRYIPPMVTKIVAGCCAGSVAAALTSPLELIKTRQQVQGSQPRSMTQVVRAVVATEGVAGLWKGAMPGMLRASLLTASQCATYDEVKRALLAATGWQDGVRAHVAVGVITGLATTTITNPVDVIKTRAFVGGQQYTGMGRAARLIFSTDGPRGFFKGWSANYLRLGPQTLITFVVAEQLRTMAGLKAL